MKGAPTDPIVLSPAFKMPAVLRGYLGARPCAERLKFIENPEKYGALLRTLYAGDAPDECDWLGTQRIRAVEEQADCEAFLAKGRPCIVSVWRKDGAYGIGYCIRSSTDGQVVDWPCSTGYNEKQLAVFKATAQPGERATFRLWAELDDYYNFDFASARSSHYSLKIVNDENTATIHGYLAKGSADSKDVLDELRPGKGQRFCVQLEMTKPLRDSSVSRVTAIKPGWWCDGLLR